MNKTFRIVVSLAALTVLIISEMVIGSAAGEVIGEKLANWIEEAD